jgi:hypothetical protein
MSATRIGAGNRLPVLGVRLGCGSCRLGTSVHRLDCVQQTAKTVGKYAP